MTDKQDYEKQLKRQLDEWKNEIQELNRKVDKVQSNMKSQYKQEIRELQNKQKTFEDKLTQLHKAGDQSWKNLRQGLDRVRTDIRQAIQSAKTKFK